jgi:hypothetical protein
LDVQPDLRTDVLELLVDGLATRLSGEARIHTLVPQHGKGLGLVALCDTQVQAAVEAWVHLVSSSVWAQVSPTIHRQPTVHRFASQHLSWTASPSPIHLVELTRRDTNAATRVLTRAELPSITHVDVWPVIGHPGRILAKLDPEQPDRLRLLVAAWAPLIEGIRQWSGLEKIAH